MALKKTTTSTVPTSCSAAGNSFRVQHQYVSGFGLLRIFFCDGEIPTGETVNYESLVGGNRRIGKEKELGPS